MCKLCTDADTDTNAPVGYCCCLTRKFCDKRNDKMLKYLLSERPIVTMLPLSTLRSLRKSVESFVTTRSSNKIMLITTADQYSGKGEGGGRPFNCYLFTFLDISTTFDRMFVFCLEIDKNTLLYCK